MLKARQASIKYSRLLEEDPASGLTWFFGEYLTPMPPPISQNYMEDLDWRIENLRKTSEMHTAINRVNSTECEAATIRNLVDTIITAISVTPAVC